MKKAAIFLQAAFSVLLLSACSNPVSNKPEPPAPKPVSYADVMAVAAKKADFYARLAFDLADGYLSDESAVKKRYGKDGKYVESLEFGLAETTGEISSSDLSKPKFKYWHYNEHHVSTVTVYSELYLLPTRALKRDKVTATAAGAGKPSHQFDIEFRQTDTTVRTGEKFDFTVIISSPGYLTAKGASINKPAPFPLYVQDFAGVDRRVDVAVYGINGKIKVTGADYTPKPADEFSINGGKIEITGTDNSANPPVSYKIVLEYSDDKVCNKPGNFTGSDGFSADYNIDNTQAYYTKGAEPSKKYYVYWDYPL